MNYPREETASLEDYLEAIYELGLMRSEIRMSYVAERLGVTKASVSRALSTLKQRGFIEQQRYGTITLTEEGRILASDVLHRHCLFRKLLVDVLGVDPTIAEADACRMEHMVSPETIEALEKFLQDK